MFSSTPPVLPLTQPNQASIPLTPQGCSCQGQQWLPCYQIPWSCLWIHLTQPPSNTGCKLSKSSSLNTCPSSLPGSHSLLGFLPLQPPLLDSLFLPDSSIFENPSAQSSDLLSSPLFTRRSWLAPKSLHIICIPMTPTLISLGPSYHWTLDSYSTACLIASLNQDGGMGTPNLNLSKIKLLFLPLVWMVPQFFQLPKPET